MWCARPSFALALVAAYEARRILPKRFAADMTHIALATIAEVDAIVSWNFKHIVRRKMRLLHVAAAHRLARH